MNNPNLIEGYQKIYCQHTELEVWNCKLLYMGLGFGIFCEKLGSQK
jgi:hypothetical protein